MGLKGIKTQYLYISNVITIYNNFGYKQVYLGCWGLQKIVLKGPKLNHFLHIGLTYPLNGIISNCYENIKIARGTNTVIDGQKLVVKYFL